ncbi:hypothetical protein RND71_041402 [Anisodus tanguticus]|uniref:PNPLA domain-containing protein n=1 Tax=Anisodus tanguticus TaxID=243964 RepID=A0AAE1UWP6_9SOLA|nr:hypothetical protein RND71_041402 [Anisodus tanguticus]
MPDNICDNILSQLYILMSFVKKDKKGEIVNVGFVVASGASMQEALDATKILAQDCRFNGTAFHLGMMLILGAMEEFVILWRPRGLLVDQFDSKEDLINAVFTSSFIPGYLAPIPATVFRNRLCIDGGLTLFMPPTSAAQTDNDSPITNLQLFNWALEPAEDDILDKIFEQGYADAAVWAQENPVEDLVRDNSSSIGSSLAQ